MKYMKNIKTDEYEVVARKRAKLIDGRFGWTGVMRAAYSLDCTVVGVGTDFIVVPLPYRYGIAGGAGEREYAKVIDAERIRGTARQIASLAIAGGSARNRRTGGLK